MGRVATVTELQLCVLRVLWDQGEASVAEVHEILKDERGLAITTVATMLTRLEKRGLVSHRSRGRTFIYRARVDESKLRTGMVREFTERLFGGDVSALMSHLLTSGQMAEGDLARVKDMIRRAEKGSERGGTD